MKYLVILILLLGMVSCIDERKYHKFDIKCYSNGTLMFHETVLTKYVSQHRGDTYWRNMNGERTEIHGDCVVRVIRDAEEGYRDD